MFISAKEQWCLRSFNQLDDIFELPLMLLGFLSVRRFGGACLCGPSSLYSYTQDALLVWSPEMEGETFQKPQLPGDDTANPQLCCHPGIQMFAVFHQSEGLKHDGRCSSGRFHPLCCFVRPATLGRAWPEEVQRLH